MRVVVSDTTAIRYLLLIGEIEILNSLYGHLIIPSEVQRELNHQSAPVVVRSWLSKLPEWVEVLSVELEAEDAFLPELDLGERQALKLSQELNADLLLLDDRKAVQRAEALRIPVAGTLTILAIAAKRGLIDFENAIERLSNTNFRFSELLIHAARRLAKSEVE